jgi:hypothetical protein
MTASESEKEQPFAESQSTSLKMLLISKKKEKKTVTFQEGIPATPMQSTPPKTFQHLTSLRFL